MFTRNLTLKLKANTASEFGRLMENEILPLLRKQPGFCDEITFVAPERSEVMAISFWETKENLETYNQNGYPELLKIVATIIEGTPKVETFVLATSTLHKLAAKASGR
jgi:heme-degrading monooxygenase HmoA